MSSPKIDFNKAWILEGSLFYVCENGQRILVDNEYLAFSGNVSELVENQLSSLRSIDIIHHLLSCDGAWSIVYYRPDLQRLFIGRDIFGQHSLVFSISSGGLALSCSVHPQYGNDWSELPYGQVTSIDIMDMSAEIHSYLSCYPEDSDHKWKETFKDYRFVHSPKKKNLLEVSRITSASLPFDPVNMLFTHLTDVIRSSIASDNIHVAVAFSGGVDSLLVSHALLTAAPEYFYIDLINVAFGADDKICTQAPDRQRAFRAVDHLRKRYPSRNFRLILVNVNAEELEYCRAQHICKECEAELRRLGSRNGGRDARVAAQLKRELRNFYLLFSSIFLETFVITSLFYYLQEIK
uniref:Asparagine synthetase domain-containing protein n=1 Tax=Heterorhabditis bacteriophora TaxID=37862 RepID=A0A1I7XFX0_HETBA